MQASDIMTPTPHCCAPDDSLREVASIMRDDDCGAVPVVDGGRLVGIITDRDLAVRALATGQGPEANVTSFMTRSPRTCSADDDVRDVQRVMSEAQVRRVPIVDASGNVVGIVSQADLAIAASGSGRVSDREVAIVVERISQPSSSPANATTSASREDTARPNSAERL